MGFDPLTAGFVASLAIGAYSTVKSQQQAKKAAAAQRDAARAQQASSAEQQANQRAQQEAERRQQVRENRIKAAQIMQSSENTGTSGSSGEAGAVSSLNTQMNTNLGAISGAAMHTNAASAYNQQASDLWFQATQYQNSANNWQQFGQLGQQAIGVGFGIYGSSSPTQDYKPTKVTNVSNTGYINSMRNLYVRN